MLSCISICQHTFFFVPVCFANTLLHSDLDSREHYLPFKQLGPWSTSALGISEPYILYALVLWLDKFQAHSFPPPPFVGHFFTSPSPRWGICQRRSAPGWGIIKNNLVFRTLKGHCTGIRSKTWKSQPNVFKLNTCTFNLASTSGLRFSLSSVYSWRDGSGEAPHGPLIFPNCHSFYYYCNGKSVI